MILRCWKCFNKPVAESLLSNFPTLFCWVYFRRIFRKIRQLNSSLMLAKVIAYDAIAVRLVIISEKKELSPSHS